MRLHELSITAFGPFVDTVHVDFDELAAGGAVPADRRHRGRQDQRPGRSLLRASTARFPATGTARGTCAATTPTPVPSRAWCCDVSIGERTFRFTRSPAWDRPKRRGTGTTRVQAHVVVEEQRVGEWVALTNRLDEAGQLVTGLLGMTCTQFTQVAMLPQGRFQAFLRATSAERHAVLQRLFRTRRFEEVERWLVDRRVDAPDGRARPATTGRAGVVNRIQEAAGVGVPEEWDLHDLEPVAATVRCRPGRGS